MVIGIDMGHCLSGAGTGAVGYVKETDKNREAGKRLIAILKAKGHTVIDCSCDNASSLSASLKEIVRKANAQKLDLFISLHLNAYKTTTGAMGVETLVYSKSSSSYPTAKKIQAELVKSIGWKDRGVKVRDDLYVLRNTSAGALLIEMGFCDSKADMDLFNSDKIAKAIYKAVIGSDFVEEAVKPDTNGKQLFYRVIAGSYTDKNNAIKSQEKLKEYGVDSFLEAFYK